MPESDLGIEKTRRRPSPLLIASFVAAGVVAIWLILVVAIAVIDGVGSGSARDPLTGERAIPRVESP